LPALAALAGCRPSGGDSRPGEGERRETPAPERIARARERGVAFLLSRQAEDGAWRSDTYGTFKDGTALTPLALSALLAAAPEKREAIRKAADYLAAMALPDVGIKPPPYGFDFALYTAALTVGALSHPAIPDHRAARDAWLTYLKRRQLTEELGWKPEEREYGGWGYSRGVPHKPKAGELIPPLTESNLSATTFALDALRAAGVPADDPLWGKALTFVRRCQNWADVPKTREPAYDDGGFFFIYDDAVRNKAGAAGKDRSGRERYHSYGSTTADGFRCLAYCGVAESDPRRRAAHDWLVKHFQAGRHPGTYAERREMDRMAVYYYYTASLARAPADLVVTHGDESVPVTRLLAEDVAGRQREDGSWVNPAHAIREDDAVLATSFALIALARPAAGNVQDLPSKRSMAKQPR
jgi:squalene-hopene/tetraprenyl-beta-curcumene cyclase